MFYCQVPCWLMHASALPVHHNVHTNHAKPSMSFCTDVFDSSTQTDITPVLSICQQTLVPTFKAESIQTDSPIHRKGQTVKCSDCYLRIHTLPIPTSNAAIKMDLPWHPLQNAMMMLQSLIYWKLSTSRLRR